MGGGAPRPDPGPRPPVPPRPQAIQRPVGGALSVAQVFQPSRA